MTAIQRVLVGLLLVVLAPTLVEAAFIRYAIDTNEVEFRGSKVVCHVEGRWQLEGEDANLFSVTLAMFDEDGRKIGTARAGLDTENQTFSVTGSARDVRAYRVQFNCRVRDGRARQSISNVLTDFFYVDD